MKRLFLRRKAKRGTQLQELSLWLTGGHVRTICWLGGLEFDLLGIIQGLAIGGLELRPCSAMPKLCVCG